MKTLINLIKKELVPSVFFGLLSLNIVNVFAQSPTGYCKVLKQPCNGSDGVLVATITSGLTPPLTFRYFARYPFPGKTIATTHMYVNSLSDTLKEYPFCSYLNISDTLGNYLYIDSTGLVPPFSIDEPQGNFKAICPKTTGTLKFTINKGSLPDSVQWFLHGIYFGTGNPMNLQVGVYVALVFSKGCNRYYQENDSNLGISYYSPIKDSIVATNANCTDGTVHINKVKGGKSPYTYHWSNGANTPFIDNLSQGGYIVTVTDSIGCYLISYVNIFQSIIINVKSTITPTTCLQTNGSVISFGSGGTSPYTYIYSNGTIGQTATGLIGGTNIGVTVTDSKGCTGNSSSYISNSTPITITYKISPSSCTAPTGSATITIKGGKTPYSIDWSTVPAKHDSTISNLPTGTYSFIINDDAGCKQSGTVFIPPQSKISAYATPKNPVCPAKVGVIQVKVSGTNPPFKYLWNTGDTLQSVSNAPVGYYSCTITDKVGCSVSKSAFIETVSLLNIGLNSTPANCVYNHDGSIYAKAYGGTPPYSYIWSNGQKGNIATGLSKGNYYVYVVDSNGCTKDNYTNVGYNALNDSCYCTIKGKVYIDQNSNCQYDTGEQAVEHIMIHCSGIGYTFTDANGNYSFIVPSGNYTLSESVLYIYPLASCQNNAQSISVTAQSGCTSIVNFANTINPLHDIHVITSSINFAVPGNQYTQSVIVQNDGTVTEQNINLGYKHDGQLQYVNTSPGIYNQINPVNQPNWYSVMSGFDTLSPGQSIKLLTNYNVPTNIPFNTTVNFGDTSVYSSPMSNWLKDYSPWNNVNSFNTIIESSFDPNFIEVLPIGKGNEGYIFDSDSVLTYVIHFQNTGTWFAENVVIIDTLDKNLILNSLRSGYSDYKYNADMSESGVLKFTFKNIHLDWKSDNEIASRGLVTYSIKHKPNLANATKINNKASVFFDYNAPVSTNTAVNTIVKDLSVKESNKIQGISIYPNPANSEINIVQKNNHDLKSIYIFDLTGRILYNEIAPNNSIHKISVSNLSNGIYFLELHKTNGETATYKFVKNK